MEGGEGWKENSEKENKQITYRPHKGVKSVRRLSFKPCTLTTYITTRTRDCKDEVTTALGMSLAAFGIVTL